MFQIKALALVAMLCAITIGCSTADNPINSPTATINQGGTNLDNKSPDIGLKKLQEDVQKRMASLPGLKSLTAPTGKGGKAEVDYDNNHYYDEQPWGGNTNRFIYAYDYTWAGPDGEDWVQYQLIQVLFQSWDAPIPAHSIIIPMNEDNYHSLTDIDNNPWHGGWAWSGYIDEQQVSYSFVENDAETGLTGLKIDFDIQSAYYPPEWGYGYENFYYGYFYCYRYSIKPEYWQYYYGYDYPSTYGYTSYTEFFPQFIETNYGQIQDGEGSSIGPYYGPDEWNGGGTPTYTLSGTAFLDMNGNGSQDGDEPGISGANVSLSDVGNTSTDSDGNYSFADVEEGTYTVSCGAIAGFSATTATSVEFELSADSDVDFGFAIDFDSFGGSSANSHGMGWWKENIRKAVQGQNRGVQISAAALETLRASLSNFALAPLNFGSLADAYAALSYNGGNAASRLARHLTASEYNFANGAYLDGDQLLTWAFVVWGEYLVQNFGNYTNGELNAAKDLFEDYNEGQIH